MLNTFDNNPKRQEKRAERERRIEEMNASVQIASDELFRTSSANSSNNNNSVGGGADAVDAALDRLGMSMPLHSTGVFGSSATTSRNSKSTGAGSDGEDEASSSSGDDDDGSKKSGRSGTDSSFNNPQYSKSFSAGMHAPPLGATDDAVSLLLHMQTFTCLNLCILVLTQLIHVSTLLPTFCLSACRNDSYGTRTNPRRYHRLDFQVALPPPVICPTSPPPHQVLDPPNAVPLGLDHRPANWVRWHRSI